MAIRYILLCSLMLLVFCFTARAQVRVMAGDVKDTRGTEGYFNKLELELRLIGDMLDDAKGVRVILQKAVDDKGRDLIDPDKKQKEFEELNRFSGKNKVDLEMKNPARQALTIQEVSGTIELFVPKSDPASTITLSNALNNTGSPVVNRALKAAGIEITVWTKEQYEAQRKVEEERIKKEMEARKKQAAADNQGDPGEAMLDGLMKIFGGMFGALSEMGENGIALKVSDAQGKLISIEFEDATGKTIERQGRMTFGSPSDQTQVHEFQEKLPENTRIKLFVMTTRSVVKSVFKLTDIPLP